MIIYGTKSGSRQHLSILAILLMTFLLIVPVISSGTVHAVTPTTKTVPMPGKGLISYKRV
jgi:hypothetical protein